MYVAVNKRCHPTWPDRKRVALIRAPGVREQSDRFTTIHVYLVKATRHGDFCPAVRPSTRRERLLHIITMISRTQHRATMVTRVCIVFRIDNRPGRSRQGINGFLGYEKVAVCFPRLD